MALRFPIAHSAKSDGSVWWTARLDFLSIRFHRYTRCRVVAQIVAFVLSEIEHFFASYNAIKGKEFKPMGRFGSARALALLRKGVKDASRTSAPREKTN